MTLFPKVCSVAEAALMLKRSRQRVHQIVAARPTLVVGRNESGHLQLDRYEVIRLAYRTLSRGGRS